MNQRKLLLPIILLTLMLSSFQMSAHTVKVEAQETDYWAVILCSAALDGGVYGGPGDAAYAYHVLNDHYAFNDIYYLHYNTEIPEVDAKANSTNFKWAITNWLANRSDSNDVIFIYVIAHGGGIAYSPPGTGIPWWGDNLTLYGGFNDDDFDESHGYLLEIQEKHVLDPYTQEPVDVNGDGRIKAWVNIDEATFFTSNDYITDDELANALDSLDGKYETLIFGTQQCMGGGLIDDLSAPNRIIFTASDETHLAVGDMDGDSLSEWSEAFFDALHEKDTSYNANTGEIIHEDNLFDADSNNDGHVSMLEVFNFTCPRTPPVEGYPQTEWLDDNGNRYPTYVNETNFGNECDDGSLAGNVWFPRKHYNLTLKTITTPGYEVSDVKVWIDGNLIYSPVIDGDITAGNHNLEVETIIWRNGLEYEFSHWEDNSTSNPRNVHIDSNSSITAYYHRQVSLNVQTRTLDGVPISNVKVWIDDDTYRLSPVNMVLDDGYHTVEVQSVFFKFHPKFIEVWKYTFKYWEDSSTNNPRTLFLEQNTTITAYYLKEVEEWGPL